MKKKYLFIIFFLLAFDIVLFISLLLKGSTIALLNPKGFIALKERNLIVTAISLMLLIVVPAVVLTFFTAWKYRASNTKAQYVPENDHNIFFELIWWVIPSVVVFFLAIITWKATHVLDPYKPIQSNSKPLVIQVVALEWKWLFIYPQQHIATVNFIQFPAHTPINFELTADAPMTSFWIPQLGGQIYAMTGMGTQTHLIADSIGDYSGSTAEINGQGFAGMRFIARASSQTDFYTWVQSVKQSQKILDLAEYSKLAAPSENTPTAFYALTEENLYNEIMMKFQPPSSPTDSQMQGM